MKNRTNLNKNKKENIFWFFRNKCFFYHKGFQQGQAEARKEFLEEEIKWLELIQENLLLDKRRKGQHRFNKISVKDRITKLKQKIKLLEELKNE